MLHPRRKELSSSPQTLAFPLSLCEGLVNEDSGGILLLLLRSVDEVELFEEREKGSDMRYRCNAWAAAVVLGCVTSASLGATVTNVSPSVSQNFDTLANTGTTNSFSAWAVSSGQSWEATSSLSAPAVGQYSASNGSSTAGSMYSFGAINSSERALGSIASGPTGTLYYGLRLTNGGTTTITGLEITYTGEQWRNGGNTAAHTLAFEYSTTASSIGDISGYVGVAALSFTGPVTGSTAAALDGNLAANRSTLTAVITGLNVLPGQLIRIRWVDLNDSGNDHGLAIDDLTVTARFGQDSAEIPLPAAAVAGPGLLAFSALRRRR